jgi:hypothetical protein
MGKNALKGHSMARFFAQNMTRIDPPKRRRNG